MSSGLRKYILVNIKTLEHLCYNQGMGWRGDQFFYGKGLLKTIAENYIELYEGLPTLNSEIMNPFELAEYKADFDMALSSLGYKKWELNSLEFKHCHGFGKLQRIVIADILRVKDAELLRCGFYDLSELRNMAYARMKRFLNGGEK